MIYVLLIFSFVFNLLCMWYIRNLLKNLVSITSNFSSMKYKLDIFKEHLSNLRKLESYSEEPVIKNLFSHIEELMDYLDNFSNEFTLLEEEDFEEEKDDTPRPEG